MGLWLARRAAGAQAPRVQARVAVASGMQTSVLRQQFPYTDGDVRALAPPTTRTRVPARTPAPACMPAPSPGRGVLRW